MMGLRAHVVFKYTKQMTEAAFVSHLDSGQLHKT
jgi:hypothetical protein